MFHPGFLNEKDEKTILDSILSAIDLEILTDRTVKQAVRKQKINLVNFETAFA
jgi:hypothetical protein